MLKRYGLENAKTYTTPMETTTLLRRHTEDSEAALVDKKLYQSMVGSLLYCALGTRPDIQFAVSTVAQFSSEPDQHHLTAVKRIFCYLKGTDNLKLNYRCVNDQLRGYSDADFARDPNERKSVSGYCFFLSGGVTS